MSPKRKQTDLDLDPIFDKVFAAADASGDKDAIVKFLKEIKIRLAAKPHKPAKSFELEEAVEYFSLTYRSEYPDSLQFHWNIEKLPDVNEIQPSHCLSSFLADYTANFDRSSEAACKVGVDVIIANSLAELKGRADEVPPIRSITPKPSPNIKAFCEISFTHSIDDTPNSQGVVVDGRVDHGVGIVLRRPMSKPNRRLHSLLLCVQAKIKDNLGSALGQLVTYLACLRESRINRGKTDSSVYGVATNGLKYLFVTITNEGVLLFSKQFDIMSGDLPVILGCFQYILQKAISMSSGVVQHEKMDDDADEGLDPDDSPYVESDEDDDD